MNTIQAVILTLLGLTFTEEAGKPVTMDVQGQGKQEVDPEKIKEIQEARQNAEGIEEVPEDETPEEGVSAEINEETPNNNSAPASNNKNSAPAPNNKNDAPASKDKADQQPGKTTKQQPDDVIAQDKHGNDKIIAGDVVTTVTGPHGDEVVVSKGELHTEPPTKKGDSMDKKDHDSVSEQEFAMIDDNGKPYTTVTGKPIQPETKKSSDNKESKNSKENKDSKEDKDSKNSKENKDTKDSKDTQGTSEKSDKQTKNEDEQPGTTTSDGNSKKNKDKEPEAAYDSKHAETYSGPNGNQMIVVSGIPVSTISPEEVKKSEAQAANKPTSSKKENKDSKKNQSSAVKNDKHQTTKADKGVHTVCTKIHTASYPHNPAIPDKGNCPGGPVIVATTDLISKSIPGVACTTVALPETKDGKTKQNKSLLARVPKHSGLKKRSFLRIHRGRKMGSSLLGKRLNSSKGSNLKTAPEKTEAETPAQTDSKPMMKETSTDKKSSGHKRDRNSRAKKSRFAKVSTTKVTKKTKPKTTQSVVVTDADKGKLVKEIKEEAQRQLDEDLMMEEERNRNKYLEDNIKEAEKTEVDPGITRRTVIRSALKSLQGGKASKHEMMSNKLLANQSLYMTKASNLANQSNLKNATGFKNSSNLKKDDPTSKKQDDPKPEKTGLKRQRSSRSKSKVHKAERKSKASGHSKDKSKSNKESDSEDSRHHSGKKSNHSSSETETHHGEHKSHLLTMASRLIEDLPRVISLQ